VSMHRVPAGTGGGVITVVAIVSLATKPETRNPRSERNPKTEIRIRACRHVRNSDFFRPSVLRPSDFRGARYFRPH